MLLIVKLFSKILIHVEVAREYVLVNSIIPIRGFSINRTCNIITSRIFKVIAFGTRISGIIPFQVCYVRIVHPVELCN